MSNAKKSSATKAPTKPQLKMLGTIVEATNSPTGFGYVDAGKAAALADAGYIEINTGMKNDEGHVAARATATGIEKIMGENTTSKTENADNLAAAPEAPQFAIDTDVPKPVVRRGRQSTLYPFDQLEVGASFHVPATDERPDPAKSLASTISSANRRYAVEVPGETRVDRKGNTVPATKQTRKFSVVRAAEDDPRGPGARVFRDL